MKIWLPLIALAASCASSSAPVDSRAAAEPVIAAERAFAARHQQVSVKRSFLENAAPDGVMVTPDGVRDAREFIATWPDDDNKGFIAWWPNLAGIARSGDLGFTTGPASFGGGRRYTDYFTVWKKQPDGSWKWMIDLGTQKGAKPGGGPDDPVAIVPVSAAFQRPATAWADLQGSEQALNRVFHSEEAETLSSLYAPEARILGWQDAPQTGRSAAAAMRRARGMIAAESKGGGVSSAGDLGWTYGYASWSEAGTAKRGPYLRVWQRRAEGWLVLVENMYAF
jgi:ketosteroid isomerase-like protein